MGTAISLEFSKMGRAWPPTAEALGASSYSRPEDSGPDWGSQAASCLFWGVLAARARTGSGAQFPPTLSRHQVLRIFAADKAQVQKVKELEDLEHLQVRGRETLRPHGTSQASWAPKSPTLVTGTSQNGVTGLSGPC